MFNVLITKSDNSTQSIREMVDFILYLYNVFQFLLCWKHMSFSYKL